MFIIPGPPEQGSHLEVNVDQGQCWCSVWWSEEEVVTGAHSCYCLSALIQSHLGHQSLATSYFSVRHRLIQHINVISHTSARDSVKLKIIFTCMILIIILTENEWNSLEENNKIALFLWFNEWLMGVWCALVNICFSQQSHLLRLLQLPLLQIQHNLAKLDSNNQTTNLVSTHWLLSDIYSVLIV